MSTKLNSLIPILICNNVQKSIRFYCDVLGFEIQDRMDDVGKTGWAMPGNGETRLMLGSPYYHPEPKKTDGEYPQAVYYFYPEEVARLRESILQKSFEVSELKWTFYGMQEFEMLDPDGHILLFNQKTDEKSASTKNEMKVPDEVLPLKPIK